MHQGVTYCEECPLFKIGCGESSNAFEMIEGCTEKWSREHPQKHKISKLEYDILELHLKYDLKFYQSKELYALLKKGYFKGATRDMNINYYFDNCEVVEHDKTMKESEHLEKR